jgi:Zn-dependent M28 family amino/carboxypeptidase
VSEDANSLIAELRRDVEYLAGEIGERNIWRPRHLLRAAEWCETELRKAGLKTRRQGYTADGCDVFNVETEVLGSERPGDILIVGAHYDSRCAMARIHGRRRLQSQPGTPGANDNASGVAAMLALARHLAPTPQPCTLRFAAFVNEEPPFFRTALMGSRVYARRCRERGEHVIGMLTPETLGCYCGEQGTQRLHAAFGRPFNSAGDFVAMLCNLGSRHLLRRTLGAFRRHSGFPVIGLALPCIVPRAAWSDDWAFWQEGYAALTITDTAFLRDPHYHTPDDTPDKLDYTSFAQVVAALRPVVEDLCADGSLGYRGRER